MSWRNDEVKETVRLQKKSDDNYSPARDTNKDYVGTVSKKHVNLPIPFGSLIESVLVLSGLTEMQY
jgi:hypothetical protein